MTEAAPSPVPVERLRARVESKEAVVGVVGLGYVGLPLAVAFAGRGLRVMGFDTDGTKADRIRSGDGYIKHLDWEAVAELVAGGALDATDDFSRLAEADCILICVPTPLAKGPDKVPDLTYVEATARQIARTLRPGQLVVLESTTYPGTTEEVVRPILDSAGLECGSDYLLAYSPEREDPGNPKHSVTGIPKVVGGVGEEATAIACALYGHVAPSTVGVSAPAVAEATKMLENTFRAVNIALVNELKMLFEKIGVDVWEVIAASSTKPFGYMPFYPGPGLGGHCIPIDPFYLSWRAKQAGFDDRFIKLAGEINSEMPGVVVERTASELAARGTEIADAAVLVLGLAYKPDVDDPRESPAFEIITLLGRRGAEVSYNDPYIPHTPGMRNWQLDLDSVELTTDTLAAADAVVVVTNHSCYDPEFIVRHSKLVIDTRNLTGDLSPMPGNVVKA